MKILIVDDEKELDRTLWNKFLLKKAMKLILPIMVGRV
jgi:hypothetical protein